MLKFAHVDEILLVFKSAWLNLTDTDFSQIKYSDAGLALKVGFVLAGLILFKLLWTLACRLLGWSKYSQKDSGHFISPESWRGIWAGLFFALPKIFLVIPLAALLFAIADPFIPVTKEEKKYVETRTRLDLRDVSGSMTGHFKNSDKTKAEVAMNAHLKFLEMRRGKNDRVAFWLFSINSYPVQEDFIMDDELCYFKAFDAPWELGGNASWDSEQFWKGYAIPKSRYLFVAGEGGTELTKTLQLAIKLFEEDEKKQKKKTSSFYRNASRAIIVVTDAAIGDFGKTKIYFAELSKMKVVPYIIFIDETAGEQDYSQLNNVPKLLREVVVRGGKFFPVSDEKALENAYKEIDKLEKTVVEIEKKTLKVPVFYKFVFAAIVSLAAAIIFGMMLELFID